MCWVTVVLGDLSAVKQCAVCGCHCVVFGVLYKVSCQRVDDFCCIRLKVLCRRVDAIFCLLTKLFRTLRSHFHDKILSVSIRF